MANEAEKERLGLLDQIRSIQEATNKIQSEQSSIMGNIVDDQTRAMEAAAKKELLDKNMLGSLQAMEKVDAVRAMMAESIADGTLEQFEIADKIAQIKAESVGIDKDSLAIMNMQLDSLAKQNEELKKKDIFGKSEADRLKEINDKAKENTETYKNTLNTLGLAVDELASMKTLVLAAGAGLVVATKEAFKLQRALGTSNGFMGTMKILGTQLSAQFQALGRGFVLSGDEARESIKALTDLQGSLNDATAAATVSVGEMAVKYGVGYKEAAQLNKTMMIMSGHSQDGADAMMNQVKNLAKAKGVAPGAVMQDIADNTVEFARFGKDGASGLVNAAANAKKLGLNLGTVVAAGDALLDVQSSIQDEMKAEMLIGRQLNLDAARQAALTGDRDTLVKEIAKNAGTLSEFENMTVVQQRALAKAMGVQVGDVTKILQAKEKGVNLDSKVLDAQSAIADETNNTAMAAGLAAQGAASLGSGLLSAIPAFAGMNSMFPSMGKGISKMFGKTAEGAADVSNKMAKIKTPKGGGKGMTDFFKSLGKIKTSSMIKAALAIAIVAVSLIPAAYAFSLLEGVDPVAMLVFGATMVGLALALTTVSAAAGPMIFGALAFGIAAIALIPAAYAMGLLTGVDPMAMLAFAGSIAILGLGIAAMGALAMPIALGTLVLFGLSKVLPAATAGFANLGAVDPAALSGFATAILPLGLGLAAFGLLSIPIALGVAALALASAVLPAVSSSLAGITGVDPAALMGFAQSLAPLALGLAAFGLIAPLAIIGAAALIVVGAATILFAKSFALMSGVDPSAIDTLGAGIKSMIKIVEDIGFIQAGKLVIKAAAIAAVGLAVLPFGMAIKAAGAGDATGLVTALKGLTEIPTIGLVMAGIGISALALGFMAFLPVAPFLGIMAESLAIITPALALLAPLGEGLALAGMGVLAFGMGMFPLALGLMLAAPFIPLMPLLAEAFVIMTPPLVALAAIAEVMPLIGTGFMSIGFGLIPFAMGMAMLAPYIPLMPTMAESLVIMTPPLIELSTIAEVLPAMGMGFMMLGMGLQSFSVAMAMLFPFQAVLPILAKTMIDLAPPLAIMAPLGPQIMYLATAIGALGIASGIAAIPLYLFAAASYFAAPAITLLGEASKVLGAGLEMVRVPLLAMASQAPQVMLLATGITALGVSLAIATPPLFAFGAGAWFAMIPVMALASGLETMVQTADGLAAVGIGLSSIASGLSEISQFNGTMALLTIAAPALALLGLTGMFGGDGGEEGGGEDGDGNGALIAKIDELIAVVNSKDYMPVLEIDGRKVGTAVARKQGPKGMGN
tara:strand:+ start:9377 stop:13300 length:3924 start_codon:yes stop_codon:yes gene_type:complete